MDAISRDQREHRLRVLEHQRKLAADQAAPSGRQADPQMKMPLIGLAKPPGEQGRPTPKRLRKRKGEQPKLGDL